MIMSSKHRNLTRDFTTEGNTVVLPKGQTLRWRQTVNKPIKLVSADQHSNGIVDVLQNEIGYSALFSQEEGKSVVKVYSYDNITGSFINIAHLNLFTQFYFFNFFFVFNAHLKFFRLIYTLFVF